jgi:DNA-3-methyladenine glycosylase
MKSRESSFSNRRPIDDVVSTTEVEAIVDRSMLTRDVAIVAQALVGARLTRSIDGRVLKTTIVETEAYGRDDPASHSFRGETPRNGSMFKNAGTAYVYLIYGVHHCVNVVVNKVGIGEAVLIRAAAFDEVFSDRSALGSNDHSKQHDRVGAGPGKLCKALSIDRSLDGVDLLDHRSPLRIESNPNRDEFIGRFGPVEAGVRIGITKAVDAPLRFFLTRHPAVSARSPKTRSKSKKYSPR